MVVLAMLAVAAVLVFRARRRQTAPQSTPASPYADAPPELAQAKRAFEQANENLLTAQAAWRAAAEEVTVTGKRMTAVYQSWATGRAATALETNGTRRASVFDRLELA